jgi:hypothetical protein
MIIIVYAVGNLWIEVLVLFSCENVLLLRSSQTQNEVSLLIAVGCGSNLNNKPLVSQSQVNVMVTGTSGALSHSTSVALTIN